MMSDISNVLILFSGMEDNTMLAGLDYFPIIEPINDWLSRRGHYELSMVAVTGGEKVWTGGIVGGAFNCLDVDSFVEFVCLDVQWKAPELVRIIVNQSDHEKFIITHPELYRRNKQCSSDMPE